MPQLAKQDTMKISAPWNLRLAKRVSCTQKRMARRLISRRQSSKVCLTQCIVSSMWIHMNKLKNQLTFFQVKGMPLGRRNLKLSVTDCPIIVSELVPHTWRSFSPAPRIIIFSLKTRPNGKRRIRTEQGTGGSVSLSRFVRLFVRDKIYSWLSKSSLNLTRTFLAPGTVVDSSTTLMVNFVL